MHIYSDCNRIMMAFYNVKLTLEIFTLSDDFDKEERKG